MSGALCDSIKSVQVMLRVAPRHSKLFFWAGLVSRLARRSFSSLAVQSTYTWSHIVQITRLKLPTVQGFPGARSMFVKEAGKKRKKEKRFFFWRRCTLEMDMQISEQGSIIGAAVAS